MNGKSEFEPGYLISCPWCGQDMKGMFLPQQFDHLIAHGDVMKGQIAEYKQIIDIALKLDEINETNRVIRDKYGFGEMI